MLAQSIGLRSVDDGILEEPQFELATLLNDTLGACRVAFAGQLYKDFVAVLPTSKLNRGLGETQRIDAPIDGFERQRHGCFLNLGDGRAPKSQRVTGRIAGGRRHIPEVRKLLADVVAKFRKPR